MSTRDAPGNLVARIQQALARNDFGLARPLLEQFVKSNKRDAHAWFLLGAVAGAMGDARGAIKASRKSLELKAGNPDALFNLGNAQLSVGKRSDARQTLGRLLRLQPRHAGALLLLGNLHDEQGDPARALDHYERALAVDPALVEARVNMAKILAGEQQIDAAIMHFAHALKDAPDRDDVIYGFLAVLARVDEPAVIARGLELIDARTCPLAHGLVRGLLLNREGNAKLAWEAVYPLLSRWPTSLSLALQLAEWCQHGGVCDEIRAMLERFEDEPQRSPEQRIQVQHALAMVEDRLGRYASAIAHARRCNEMKLRVLPENLRFQEKKFANFVDRLIRAFPQDAPQSRGEGAGSTVFIVGMPRSGTSLVEQMIASHPAVQGGGERDDIPNLLAELLREIPGGGRDATELAKLPEEAWLNARARYQETMVPVLGDARCVTDKLPHNFLNLGAISRLLPGASVIHMVRDPLDTCVSIFMQDFGPRHAYGYRLETLARYYQHYQKLMAHWRMLSGIRLLEVSYERLVAEPEAELRRVLEFLGLEWAPEVLAFHRNRRFVNTASSEQVREPLHTRSIDRWRRYGDELRPLIDALASADSGPGRGLG